MNPFKVQSRRGSSLYVYEMDGGKFVACSHAGLADYMTRFKGEAWGVAAERIRFTKGKWAGKTLAEVGINERTFNALADGWSLCHDERLIPPGPNGRHVPGFDFQLSPSKSTSVAAMNRQDRRLLLRAHQRAVKAAFKIMEQALVCQISVPTSRFEPRLRRDGRPCKTQGSDTRPVQGELIAFASTHWTSRPTKETNERESGPDPQLHTHVFIFNMAWAEGKFRAVDHQGLFHQAKLAEAVYQAHLAHEMAEAGIKIDPFEDAKGLRSFELAGHDLEANWFFSTRSREVQGKFRAFEHGYGRPPTEEELQELAEQFVEMHKGRWPSRQERARMAFDFEHGHGKPPTEAEQDLIKRSGRMPKERSDGEPDFESQIAALESAGIKLPQLVYASHYDPYAAPKEERQAETLEEAVKYLHQRFDSAFPRFEVPPAIWRSSIGRLRPQEVEELMEEVNSSGELVTVEHHKDHAQEKVTTRTLLDKEQELLSGLPATANEPMPAPSSEHVQAAKDAEESRLRKATGNPDARLHEEQHAAIDYLTRGVRWAALVGYAGSGKTICCRPVVDAYRRAGLVDKVIMVSTAGRTAKASAKKIGADMSCTIERLHGLVSRGKLKMDERTLVIVDEAAMLDTKRAVDLVEDTRHCIVRTVGDPAQAEAIGAGGWYQEADKKIGHVTLSVVQRQKDPEDRQVCLDIREGRAKEALDNLDRRGRFHVEDTHAETVGRLVSDYGHGLDAGYCRKRPDGGD